MKFLTLALPLLLLVSCKSKWEREYEQELENKGRFEALLEADLGQSITLMKVSGANNSDYLVYKIDATGEFRAFNYSKWDKSFTLDSFKNTAVEGVDIVGNMAPKSEWVESGHYDDIMGQASESKYDYWTDCGCWETRNVIVDIVVGQEWHDTSGYITFYYGGGFRFSNSSVASKDLETQAAQKEHVKQEVMAASLGSRFGLSEDRAQELANLTLRYRKLENTGELTASEKDQFALSALGVSMNDVEGALKKKAQGQEEQYQEMLKKAATVNQTSPELIGQFFEDLI